jgi:HTH-type transcriptional regulator/antitoxin HigA
MEKLKKITTESEYRSVMAAMEIIIERGTKLGDMELLSEKDKTGYSKLSKLALAWEKGHYNLKIN